MNEVGSRSSRPRHSLALGLVSGALLALIAAPAALADTTQSSNWAGYAVHHSGVHFRKVIGTWRQPTAVCDGSGPTFSSVWVGIGGFSLNSQALEQIGSEVDCDATGQLVSNAWYELVPAPSHAIHMRVDPGDQLSASVLVDGHQTTLTLRDLTRGTLFTRRVPVKTVDVSSAEWIVEAPSQCSTPGSCQTLNLANFGTAAFTSARATNRSGHTGSVSDRHWGVTRITLAAGQHHFISSSSNEARAAPSPLTAGGSAFSVTYQATPTPTPPPPSPASNRARQARVSDAGRLRPGGARRAP